MNTTPSNLACRRIAVRRLRVIHRSPPAPPRATPPTGPAAAGDAACTVVLGAGVAIDRKIVARVSIDDVR
ncbi:MAG: hypothetical protein U0235_08370 [Polyangiaceae bacterium]